MPCVYLNDELYNKFSGCCRSEYDKPHLILEAFMEKYCHDYSKGLPYETEVITVTSSFVVLKSHNFHLSADRELLPQAKVGDKVNVTIDHTEGQCKCYNLDALTWHTKVDCKPNDSHVIADEYVK